MNLFLLNLGRGFVVRAKLCPSASRPTTQTIHSRLARRSHLSEGGANTWLMRLSLAYTIILASSIQLLAHTINGQTIDKELVTTELQNGNPVTLIKQIEAQSTLRFIYLPEQLNKYNGVFLTRAKRSIRETLDLAFEGTGLVYEQSGKYVLLKEVGTVAVPAVSEAIATLVTGTVKDQDGLTLAGVSVVVKGTTRGTTTDAEGRYAIEMNSIDDILVFSFIGFKPMEVKVGGQSDIKVTLEYDVTSLKEVQVVGTTYWQTTKEMSVMNIAKVESEDIENQPVTNPLIGLQGRMAGVDITPVNGVPGGAIKIQIRGSNSFKPDGANPLYIIDGVPVDSRPLESGSTSLLDSGFDPLSTISPANIESIEVLKDGAATAIYGSRGANGVVRITTKKGKAGATSIEVTAYSGVGNVPKRLDLLNTQQYLSMRREAYKNDVATPAGLVASDLLVWDTTRYTDWQKTLLGGTANITDIQGNLSGGVGNTTFRLGGAYHKEGMIFPGDLGYDRVTGQFSLNHRSGNNKLNVAISGNLGVVNSNTFDDINFVNYALTLPPNAPSLYSDDGSLNWEPNAFGLATWVNPLSVTKKKDNLKNRTLIVNTAIAYEIAPGLNVKANIGYTDLNGSETVQLPISSNSPSSINQYSTGQNIFTINRRTTAIIEPQLGYSKTFSHHNMEVIFGQTIQKSQDYLQQLLATGYASDASLGNLLGATLVQPTRDEDTDYRYLAYFFRVAYNFKEKYIIDVTGRRDGSSRFSPKNQYGNFGGVGLGWIFSKESFFSPLNGFISFGKLRGSLASTGNDQIGDYQFYSTYTKSTDTYAGQASLRPTALFNPNFGWEVTRKIELGLELSFLDNRIFLEGSYFRNTSSNQLIDYQLPGSTGFSSVLKNFNATIQNSGWELLLRTENVKNEDWSWVTSVNYTIPKNRLVQFPGIETSSYNQTYSVGNPLSISYLYTWEGVDSMTGRHKFTDFNDDGMLDFNDKRFMNLNLRKSYGGINNAIRYKNLELSFLIQLVDQTAPRYTAGQIGRAINQPTYVQERWRTEGQVTEIPRFTQRNNLLVEDSNINQSSYLITNARFMRLKTLSLAYTLPQSLLKRINISDLKFTLQGQNLITRTSYLNLDPETGSSLPPLKIITFGVMLKI